MAWKKGQSGNPGGRPKNPFLEMVDKDRKSRAKELYDKVWKILRTSKDEGIVLQAATWIRDTTWGKPVQAVEHSGEVDHRVINITRANGAS